MEQTLETIVLDVEESNELLFKVKVEGLEQAPAKVRLVCETGDVAYMFNGHGTADDGVVQFLLPVLKDKLKEGVYQSRVEVLIENRYFAPVEFNINFKKAVSVVAEAVQLPQRRVVPQIKVTASPVIVAKKQPIVPAPVVSRPIVVQEQTVKQQIAPSTLRERYKNRAVEEVIEEVDAADEDLIKELARGFVRSKQKR